jgi:hypothetical protein
LFERDLRVNDSRLSRGKTGPTPANHPLTEPHISIVKPSAATLTDTIASLDARHQICRTAREHLNLLLRTEAGVSLHHSWPLQKTPKQSFGFGAAPGKNPCIARIPPEAIFAACRKAPLMSIRREQRTFARQCLNEALAVAFELCQLIF